MNLETLKAALIQDEGLKLTVYKDSIGIETIGLEVLPPLPVRNDIDGFSADPVLGCQFTGGNDVRGVSAPDVFHLSRRELGGFPARFASPDWLEAGLDSVDHLFAHRGEGQVACPVVGLDPIDMVHCHAIWDGAVEGLENDAVDRAFDWVSVGSSRKRDAKIAGVADVRLQWSVFSAPKSGLPHNVSEVADFVQAFVSSEGLPYAI